jgi:hypothetical protein
MVKSCFAFLLAFLFVSCGNDAVVSPKGDGIGPSILVDSMYSGDEKILDSGTTSLDSVKLFLTVKDPSGIEYVSAKVGSLGEVPASRTGSDSVWSVVVYLVPGPNVITVKAEDNQDNESFTTSKVVFSTNYLPIDNNSKWTFIRNGVDTFKIECDSSYKLGQAPFNFFRVKFRNPKFYAQGADDRLVLDTVYFAQSITDSVIKVGEDDYLAQSGDTLFRKSYTSLNTTNSFRFIGDTSFTISGIQKRYRNCIKVSTSNQSKQIVGITDYYMVPGKGFVAIQVQPGFIYTVIPNLTQHPLK